MIIKKLYNKYADFYLIAYYYILKKKLGIFLKKFSLADVKRLMLVKLKVLIDNKGYEAAFKKNITKDYLLCGSVEDLKKKSHVFCMAPWVHIHLLPDGNIIPCCLAPYSGSFGNANKKTLIKIWNSFQYRTLRTKMIWGIKSNICKECYGYEAINKKSFRMHFNSDYQNEFELIKKTSYSGHIDKMNIRYFDIRFSNICNFKCRGCGPELSSSWQGDYKKFFFHRFSKSDIINCTEKGTNQIWEQLTTFIPGMHEALFAGGEPLLMDEHYKTLEILLKNNRNDVVLTYITNLSITKFKQYDIFDLWQHFNILNINVSVDDIGARGEYYRKGLKWDNLVNNLNMLKERLPHANLSIMMTVNILNVYYIPEIYRFFIQNGYIGEDKFYFNILKRPLGYNMQVSPIGFKNKIREKLTGSISELKTTLPDKDFSYYEQFINIIIDFLYKQSYPAKSFKEFIYRNNKLDKIRNENFVEVYPELAFFHEIISNEKNMS
jgi:radical SAM protein with 4Fe4S-binding SPASM domain